MTAWLGWLGWWVEILRGDQALGGPGAFFIVMKRKSLVMKRKSGVGVLGVGGRRKTGFVRNFKWQGELAEMAFLYKAASMGFTVTKPYGENESYDFIVDSGNRFWRVQVKSASSMNKKAYRVAARHFWRRQKSTNAYTAEQIDILAAYIVPVGAWYIIPVEAFTPSECLSVFPHIPGHGGTYEQFREAWFLMACRRGGEPREGIVTSPTCTYSAGSGKACEGCGEK
jgi:PD-(D/E)XK endonuclease